MTYNRFSDALAIAAGACNPSGIALAIAEACADARRDEACDGTRYLTDDPAIRLMVHQLAFITGVISGAEEFSRRPGYSDCRDACLLARDNPMPKRAVDCPLCGQRIDDGELCGCGAR